MPSGGTHTVPIQVPVPEDVRKAVADLSFACVDWQSEYYQGHRVSRTLESDICFLVETGSSLWSTAFMGLIAGVVICVAIFLVARFSEWRKQK